EVARDDLQLGPVPAPVDRVAAGQADDVAVQHRGAAQQAGAAHLFGGEGHQAVGRLAPDGVLVEAPVLDHQDGGARAAVELRRPVAEVGDPPHPEVGGVHVEPVVREEVRRVDVQVDQQGVAEGEAGGGALDL